MKIVIGGGKEASRVTIKLITLGFLITVIKDNITEKYFGKR